MAIGTYISIITLNLNGLNALTKRHKLAEWTQKQDPYICCLQETHFRPKDTYRLNVRGWKNIFHANGKQKKAGVAILISDKIDLKIKGIANNKEGQYIMIKGAIQEEDITTLKTYAPNTGAPQYVRQTLTEIKREIDSNIIMLLSHFSRVRFYVTPETAAHQASLSLGFSRQEHWSGLPFSFPMLESKNSREL